MQLLKTEFDLRSDLRWSEDVYQSSIYAWISGSENKKTHKKNYADLLRELPRKIDFKKHPSGEFSSVQGILKYKSFSDEGYDFLAFWFSYKSDNRKWETQIALRRTPKDVQCFVALNCDLENGAKLPSIQRPKIIDHLLEFQEIENPITAQPTIITNADIPDAVRILNGTRKESLPIVYLSCSEQTHALKPSFVANKLCGIAHVYAEQDKTIFDKLNEEMKGNVYPRRGEIGILYAGKPIHILNRYANETWKEKPEILVQEIYLKILKENLSIEFPFSTTDFLKAAAKFKSTRDFQPKPKIPINLPKKLDLDKYIEKIQAILVKKDKQIAELKHQTTALRSEKEKFQSDSETFYNLAENYEREANKAKEELHKIKAANENLQHRLQMRNANENTFPLQKPTEPEMFEDEFVCHLISYLKLAQKNLPKSKISHEARTSFILEKILDANSDFQQIFKDRNKDKEQLLNAAKKQNLHGETKVLKPFLMNCLPKDNNHWKISFEKDLNERFVATEASTPSERRHGGGNETADLKHAMFWPD